ncbi:insulin receptor substrate 1-B-like isoform X1 [Branchiostoma floridae x Branchiostoma japonicum]
MMSAGGDTPEDVRKHGYLRKLKARWTLRQDYLYVGTMKKRYFVLHAKSSAGAARLEYFDNEKKWRHGAAPKRTIFLHHCFNINKKDDGKHKHMIVLYTRDECFSLVADTADEHDTWLAVLKDLHESGSQEGFISKQNFEHVWQVTLKPKGLGSSKNLTGQYRLCLTANSITLLKMNSEEPAMDFQLTQIRRCGHVESFFLMEVGRSAVTGAGELWMQVEDTLVAQNMHEAILSSMKAISSDDEFRPRSRSSGSSNPLPVPAGRRMTGTVPTMALSHTLPTRSRMRCDSLPTAPGRGGARYRTTSEGEMKTNSPVSPSRNRTRLSAIHQRSSPRSVIGSHGMFNRSVSAAGSLSQSPISGSPLSPSPTGFASDQYAHPLPISRGLMEYTSDGSTVSMDEYDSSPASSDHYLQRYVPSGRSLTPDSPSHTPIREEGGGDGYVPMAPAFPGGYPTRSAPQDVGYPTRSTPQEGSYMPMSGGIGRGSPTTLSSRLEDGYMPMSPGTPPTTTDMRLDESYMSMSPSSVSAPRQIVTRRPANGDPYVTMSPGSRSPDHAEYMQIWANQRPDNRQNNNNNDDSSYMSMSPVAQALPNTSIPDTYIVYSPSAESSPPAAVIEKGQMEATDGYVHMEMQPRRTGTETARRTGQTTQDDNYMAMDFGAKGSERLSASERLSSSLPAEHHLSSSPGGTNRPTTLRLTNQHEYINVTPTAAANDGYAVMDYISGDGGVASSDESRTSAADGKTSTSESGIYSGEESGRPRSPGEYVNIDYSTKGADGPGSEGDGSEYMNLTYPSEKPSPKIHVSDYSLMAPVSIAERAEKGAGKSPGLLKQDSLTSEDEGLSSQGVIRHSPVFSTSADISVVKNSKESPEGGASPVTVETAAGTSPVTAVTGASPVSGGSYENVSLGSRQGGGLTQSSQPGSRHSSVSSEKELNYISLDLPSDEGEGAAGDDNPVAKATRSPRSSVSSEDKADENPYASIDFTKSEGLRNTSPKYHDRDGRF